MSLANVHSRALIGINTPAVSVEVHLSRGLPCFSIVGLPATAVKESRDRVRSAITNNGFEFPLKRITVNLAPADLPKEGGRYDLAIAIGILAASNQINTKQLDEFEFIGELALSGAVRAVKGILPTAHAVKTNNRSLFLPVQNLPEACLVSEVNLYAVQSLNDVVAHLMGHHRLEKSTSKPYTTQHTRNKSLTDVCGQYRAKRALQIAAAGRHNMLMIGPPGTGKTMLAERLPGLLPELSEQEAMESAIIASISQRGFKQGDWLKMPFRSPHHSASAVAMVGGGSPPKPGEISLAHNGVLFLDELPEFDRKVLEVLREPIESGSISISRAAHQCEFPANFQLLAAMNPCPCGYYGATNRECKCHEEQILKYRNKLSGPLLDRFDLQIEVNASLSELFDNKPADKGEDSQTIRQGVIKARSIQLQRSGQYNSRLNQNDLKKYCLIQKEDWSMLQDCCEKLGISARGFHRILKLSRTIADIDNSHDILRRHLTEALSYRCLDKSQANS